jgi:hypothetical protein
VRQEKRNRKEIVTGKSADGDLQKHRGKTILPALVRRITQQQLDDCALNGRNEARKAKRK